MQYAWVVDLNASEIDPSSIKTKPGRRVPFWANSLGAQQVGMRRELGAHLLGQRGQA